MFPIFGWKTGFLNVFTLILNPIPENSSFPFPTGFSWEFPRQEQLWFRFSSTTWNPRKKGENRDLSQIFLTPRISNFPVSFSLISMDVFPFSPYFFKAFFPVLIGLFPIFFHIFKSKNFVPFPMFQQIYSLFKSIYS